MSVWLDAGVLENLRRPGPAARVVSLRSRSELFDEATAGRLYIDAGELASGPSACVYGFHVIGLLGLLCPARRAVTVTVPFPFHIFWVSCVCRPVGPSPNYFIYGVCIHSILYFNYWNYHRFLQKLFLFVLLSSK